MPNAPTCVRHHPMHIAALVHLHEGQCRAAYANQYDRDEGPGCLVKVRWTIQYASAFLPSAARYSLDPSCFLFLITFPSSSNRSLWPSNPDHFAMPSPLKSTTLCG